jgi:hypothetical protein
VGAWWFDQAAAWDFLMPPVVDRPFHESFLERIVGVNFGGGSGGVFVSGDECCFERYAMMETFDSPQKWVGLGSLAFSPSGNTAASSYGLTHVGPIFLLGGSNHSTGPILMRSRDGKEWENIGAATAMAQSHIDKLVWDAEERRFYLQGDGTGQRPFYSHDGLAWYFAYESFESHCKGPLEGVADGVYGYNPRNGVIIAPDGTAGAIVMQGNQTFNIDVGMYSCNCVAYVGGIWMAGGYAYGSGSSRFSVTTSSIDGGNTWFYSTLGDIDGMTGFPEGYEITTMIGAPIRDFRR